MTGNQYLGVKIPVPADWATVAPTKIRKNIYSHYGITKTVVDRWVKETGVQPLGRYDRLQTVMKRPSKIKGFTATSGNQTSAEPLTGPAPVKPLSICAGISQMFIAATFSCISEKAALGAISAAWRTTAKVFGTLTAREF